MPKKAKPIAAKPRLKLSKPVKILFLLAAVLVILNAKSLLATFGFQGAIDLSGGNGSIGKHMLEKMPSLKFADSRGSHTVPFYLSFDLSKEKSGAFSLDGRNFSFVLEQTPSSAYRLRIFESSNPNVPIFDSVLPTNLPSKSFSLADYRYQALLNNNTLNVFLRDQPFDLGAGLVVKFLGTDNGDGKVSTPVYRREVGINAIFLVEKSGQAMQKIAVDSQTGSAIEMSLEKDELSCNPNAVRCSALNKSVEECMQSGANWRWQAAEFCQLGCEAGKCR